MVSLYHGFRQHHLTVIPDALSAYRDLLHSKHYEKRAQTHYCQNYALQVMFGSKMPETHNEQINIMSGILVSDLSVLSLTIFAH